MAATSPARSVRLANREKGTIMSKLIVGVDGSDGSHDAITLASMLAGITGAEIVLVNGFPYDQHPSRAVNTVFESHLRRDSEELLERLRDLHGDVTVEVRAVPNPSPPMGSTSWPSGRTPVSSSSAPPTPGAPAGYCRAAPRSGCSTGRPAPWRSRPRATREGRPRPSAAGSTAPTPRGAHSGPRAG